jgi:hypothetical protein
MRKPRLSSLGFGLDLSLATTAAYREHGRVASCDAKDCCSVNDKGELNHGKACI